MLSQPGRLVTLPRRFTCRRQFPIQVGLLTGPGVEQLRWLKPTR